MFLGSVGSDFSALQVLTSLLILYGWFPSWLDCTIFFSLFSHSLEQWLHYFFFGHNQSVECVLPT